jgi:glycine oxidase
VNSFDFLIVGGGVIGLSIARELHRRGGRNIGVLERGDVGKEASWAAAGMLSPDIDADLGSEFHRFSRRSLEMYPALAEELKEETGIDIELDRSGTFCLSFCDDAGLQELYERQIEGGVSVDFVSPSDISKAEPSISQTVREGLFYPNNWQVENRKLLDALRIYCERNGIRIFENTPIENLKIESGKVRGVATAGSLIEAENVVIATGAWTSLIKIADRAFPFDVKPVRGQMIAFRPERLLIRSVVHSSRGYLVPRRDGRILAGATSEDVGFEKAVTTEAVERLYSAAVKILPALDGAEIVDSWSGLRPCTEDKLPVIGGFPGYRNLTVATGHYRNGILLAPLTAIVVADNLIDDIGFPSAFAPSRFLGETTAASV